MNFNQPKTGRRAALREEIEEPCRGKQRLSCWLRYWLNFTRLYHYQVSYKMKNFRLLYQQTTPVTLFPICFCLFVFVVVVFFLSRENFEKLMREGGNSIETRTNHLPWLEDRTHSYKWRGERLSVPQSHWVNSLQRNAAEAWKKYFLTWLNRVYKPSGLLLPNVSTFDGKYKVTKNTSTPSDDHEGLLMGIFRVFTSKLILFP